MRYHDPMLQAHQERARSVMETQGADALRAQVERLRREDLVSARREAGVGYAELGAAATDDAEAARLLHYSGHQFRQCGDEAKAARAYEGSYLRGVDAVRAGMEDAVTLHRLNMRSIRRAERLFAMAGDAEGGLRAARLKEDGAALMLELTGQHGAALAHALWRAALGCNLELGRTAVASALCLVAAFVTDSAAFAVLALAATLVTAFRRLRLR